MMNKSFKRVLLSAVMAVAVWGTQAASLAQADSVLAIDLNGALPVTLKTAAKDVIVGNPGVIDVSLQTPEHLVIIGKQPGRTRLMILDGNQKVVLNQVVIVTEGDAGMVSVYGPRKGVMAQSDYACGYHCTIIPGEAPAGVKESGGSSGGSGGAGGNAGASAGDSGGSTTAAAATATP